MITFRETPSRFSYTVHSEPPLYRLFLLKNSLQRCDIHKIIFAVPLVFSCMSTLNIHLMPDHSTFNWIQPEDMSLISASRNFVFSVTKQITIHKKINFYYRIRNDPWTLTDNRCEFSLVHIWADGSNMSGLIYSTVLINTTVNPNKGQTNIDKGCGVLLKWLRQANSVGLWKRTTNICIKWTSLLPSFVHWRSFHIYFPSITSVSSRGPFY